MQKLYQSNIDLGLEPCATNGDMRQQILKILQQINWQAGLTCAHVPCSMC